MNQSHKYNKITQLPCDNDLVQYTDNDLFQILDLNNPTDRELEAKLYSLIDKYQTIKNNVGQQMKNFYIGIFKHFFETQEDEELEQYNEEEKDPLLQNPNKDPHWERFGVGNLKEGFDTQPEAKTDELTQSNNNDPPIYTKNVDYTRGSLNPILKETIKRVVSIDSSFRNKKTYPFSTEFTFNLTETLHDVVSLKLYSVSIPYNWYTINQNFGSNFFYIKGVANGIDNNNFEYKVDIGYGNYTDVSLIQTVNESIQRNIIDKNLDINFGKTTIEHSKINGRCKFTMDIKNNYNETNYYLNFPQITYSNTDPTKVNSSKKSIPELFGYSKQIYYPFTIYSNTFTPNNESTEINTNNTLTYINNNLYTLNTSNNYFYVEIYEGSIKNDKITSYPISSTSSTSSTAPAIIKTITVSLETIAGVVVTSSTTFSGTNIFNELNSQLGSHKGLINSINNSKNQISSLIRAVKFNDSSFNITEKVYTFELSVRPNRKTTVNILNQKMIIRFPDERTILSNPVWTGNGSLFQFPNTIMNFQNINGEINSSTTSYDVSSYPYILLRCILPGFYTNNPYPNSNPPGSYIATDLLGTAKDVNDFKIDIPNSPSSGYILSQYYAGIQNSLNNLDLSTNGQVKGTVTNTSENYTSFNFGIDYQITSDNFYIDTRGSFLNDIFKFDTSLNGGSSYTTVIDYTTISITNTNKTFVIKSKTDKSLLIDCSVNIPASSYNSILSFNSAINIAFNDFSKNNIYISASSFISTVIQNGNKIQTVFTLDIRAKLTNRDYILYFFNRDSIFTTPKTSIGISDDNYNIYNVYYYSNNYSLNGDTQYATYPYQYKWSNKTGGSNNYVSSNTWGLHFGFRDFSYSLINASGGNQSVTGTTINTTNQLYLTSANNKFELVPIYDAYGGVYNIKNNTNSTNNNVIPFTINLPLNTTYSKQIITVEINKLLQSNELTRGSYFNAEDSITTIRLNINKIFTTKDYSLVFYDVNTFTQCNYGSHSSAQVTTTDTTLGWKMGFRSNIFYNLTPENVTTNTQDSTTYYGNYIANTYTYDAITNIATLTGDTSVNVNLYNYFLIVLDDYTQNHLNDGLITTTIADTDVPLPSYASKASRKCIIPINKEGVSDTNSYQNRNSLTNAQLYSANQVLNTKMTKYSKNIFSNGPFVQDIFGMIPMKTAGLTAGQTYSEFGGTLQIQERVYFGPVNISRMTVRIITDKGNVLDLNNLDWAFSLITEQLYNPNKG